jgi:hypothetical protein
MMVDLTGDYRTNILSAARRLLSEGANPSGAVEVWRDGKLSISGDIGQCSKWSVREPDNGKPVSYLARYVPFPASGVRGTGLNSVLPVSEPPNPQAAVLGA